MINVPVLDFTDKRCPYSIRSSLDKAGHVLHRPPDATVHRCETMLSECVKKNEVELKSYVERSCLNRPTISWNLCIPSEQ